MKKAVLAIIFLLTIQVASAQLVVDDWYPKFNHFVLRCGSGDADSYTWDFGDNQTLDGITNGVIYHVFKYSGLRTVMCQAQTGNQTQTYALDVNVNTTIAEDPEENTQNVSANIEIAPFYPQDNAYVFICNGENYDPVGFTWDFNDGEEQVLSTNQDVFHRFKEPGTYNVSCKAADDENVATTFMQVTVEPQDIPASIEVNETPVNETPVNETPVNETPVNETPVNDTTDLPYTTLSVKEHIPEMNAYIFKCTPHNYQVQRFSWWFGDGEKLRLILNDNVYHTYEPGIYNITCAGSVAGLPTVFYNDTITINVGNVPVNDTEMNDTIPEMNDTQDNDTEMNDTIPEINDTQDNDTEMNDTIPEINDTEDNDTEMNDTVLNDTETNETESLFGLFVS